MKLSDIQRADSLARDRRRIDDLILRLEKSPEAVKLQIATHDANDKIMLGAVHRAILAELRRRVEAVEKDLVQLGVDLD